jgi:hypothetical protein
VRAASIIRLKGFTTANENSINDENNQSLGFQRVCEAPNHQDAGPLLTQVAAQGKVPLLSCREASGGHTSKWLERFQLLLKADALKVSNALGHGCVRCGGCPAMLAQLRGHGQRPTTPIADYVNA